MKRKVADELTQRKNLEIAALWGNTNLDNEKEPELRQQFMTQIEESYNTAVAALYGYEVEDEDEVDESDPFWQAMNRGVQKRKLPEPKM